jgi:Leucine-rich repeat (LRR) protein
MTKKTSCFLITAAGCLAVSAVNFVGCEKVPTFQELSGQQPSSTTSKSSANPTQPAPSKIAPAALPDIIPQKSADPASVIAAFRSRLPHQITDTDLKSLTDLPNGLEEIVSVNLDGSAVSDDGIPLLVKCQRLSDLSLKGTKIRGSCLASLGKLTELRRLTLSGVSLDPVNWSLVCELPNLEILDVTSTTITDDDVAKLTNLANLKELNLTATPVTDAGIAHLAKSESLEVLRMEALVRVNGSGFEAFAKTKGKPNTLREVHASMTHLAIPGFRHLKAIPSLEVLDISKTDLIDMQLNELRGASNISTLKASHNRLSGPGMTIFATMRRLQSLDLHNMGTIDDSCLAVLSKNKKLKRLNVLQTNCTQQGLQTFAKLQKQCELNSENSNFGKD